MHVHEYTYTYSLSPLFDMSTSHYQHKPAYLDQDFGGE